MVEAPWAATQICVTFGSVMGFIAILYAGILCFRPDIVDMGNRVQDTPVWQLQKEYDFIVVGGGSAGAVVASRLSENPDWSVLLLEAGTEEPILSELPLLFPSLQLTAIDWQFKTQPSDKFCLSQNGVSNWPRGKVIGGCSILNAMLYVRGNRLDYDFWEQLGNKGWSYNDVLPFFKKAEDVRIPEYINSPYRGTGGYLSVERLRYQSPITKTLLAASKDIGYNVIDLNGPTQVGFDFTQGTLRDGLRCSTAKAYLRPAQKRPNLQISLYSHVTKILINHETKEAEGVLFQKNGGLIFTALARKEVIISAGAVKSPQLLMLSGIGPRNHLIEKGIQPIVDLHGVGRNLQDHVAMGGITFMFDSPPTSRPYGAAIVLPRLFNLKTYFSFLYEKKGPIYSLPFCELMGFVNTKYNNNTNWPDVQLIIATAGDNDDGGLFNRKDAGLTDEAFTAVYKDILYKDSFTIVPLLMRPNSNGRILLSDNNPNSAPVIYPNYFDNELDIKVLREGAKIAHRMGTSQTMKNGYNARYHAVPFPGCEKYEMLSDEYWECQARHYTLTIYHPTCTCKMGPPTDREAVVDPELRVYGINKLRVVDASVMAKIVTGNTNAPTIMIGEKASDMIKRFWLPLDNKLTPAQKEEVLTQKTKPCVSTGFSFTGFFANIQSSWLKYTGLLLQPVASIIGAIL